ncbi:MAG: hypothetical protein OXP12_08615 [Thaumarchaeota archaeon]|nr:hypothetical protein [Nitrososphaerota archaeon]MDE0266582.1 hypothetical protein [Nitrososphaerota archaeon]MDE0526192.1 hypothetical protein [Nitrososphaerota archaeon]
MGTIEEIRGGILRAVDEGVWAWYTADGIELLLDGVTDGDGGALFMSPGGRYKLQPILDDLERDGKIESRMREGANKKEYSIKFRSI